MARRKKNEIAETVETNEQAVEYKREVTRRSNAEIAREVKAGKYGDNWEYAVRKLGYSVVAVKVLLGE